MNSHNLGNLVTGLRPAFLGLVLLLAALWPSRAEAQVLYGSIVGNVTDPTQAAIPGAKVVITHLGTNLSRDTVTNEAGSYTFTTVQAGTYTLRVSVQGFKEFVRSAIGVSPNDVTRANVALEVGAVAERIEVTAQTAVLQADRAEVRAELPRDVLQNVPLPPGRNYEYLLGTIPGFTPPVSSKAVPSSPSRSLNYNVNGTSRNTNNTRIDGAMQTNIWLPDGQAYIPALESIASINIVTNSFDAEQSFAGGAAINVQVKSGTNTLHGSAFEYHNDNALKAKPVLLPRGERNPKAIFNQFGGTVGGPIKKDKIFYFLSYEGTTERDLGSVFVTLPTLAMRNGDMTGSPNPVYDPLTGNPDGSGRTAFPGNMVPQDRFDPVVKKILPMIPAPTFPDRLTNNYFATAPYTQTRHTVDAKVNWNASQKFNMYGRFSLLRYTALNAEIFGPLGGRPVVRNPEGDPGDAFGSTYGTTIAGTYVFSPTFVVDANFGWTRMDTSDEQARLDEKVGLDFLGIPGTNGPRRFEGGWPRVIPGWTGIQSSDFAGYGVCCPWMPYYRSDPQWNYVANASWTKRGHSIRFGGEFDIQHLNHAQAEFPGVALHGPQGGFGFTGGPTALRLGASPNLYNSYGTFLLGLSSETGRNLQVPDTITTRAKFLGFYIRDQWQVTPKLTLTLGLRWDYFPMPTRADRGAERYDPVTNKMLVCGIGSIPDDCGVEVSNRQFAPRLGIAYRARPSLVIRAGYGLSWDPFPVARQLRTNYPVLVALNLEGANTFQWATRMRDGIPPIPTPDLGNGVIPMPGQVGVGTMPTAFERGYIQSWNLTIQKELAQGFTAQAGYVATRQNNQMGVLDINAGRPGGGQASQPLNQRFGRTATTRLIQPIGNSHYDSLQATVQRRFAQGVSFTGTYTWSKVIGICCSTTSTGGPAIPLPDYYSLNRALSPINVPHTLAVTSVAELPFGKGKAWLNRGGVASAIAGGWQVNGIFSAVSGLPFSVTASSASLNAPGSTQRADQVKGEVRILGGTGPGQSYFDPLAFAPVRDARFGTAGFNTLKGPTSVQLDLGLFRRFKMTERFSMEFRAEAYNFTNTPHWGNPGTNVSNMQLNADGSIRSLGGYTEITTTRTNGRENIDERVFRLGLRFAF